jgi:hypothetical protein
MLMIVLLLNNARLYFEFVQVQMPDYVLVSLVHGFENLTMLYLKHFVVLSLHRLTHVNLVVIIMGLNRLLPYLLIL